MRSDDIEKEREEKKWIFFFSISIRSIKVKRLLLFTIKLDRVFID